MDFNYRYVLMQDTGNDIWVKATTPVGFYVIVKSYRSDLADVLNITVKPEYKWVLDI